MFRLSALRTLNNSDVHEAEGGRNATRKILADISIISIMTTNYYD